MNTSCSTHTFHIPVMGTGFTIDAPVKVAPFGISSVISLTDDMLIEKMREFYCRKLNIPFNPISSKDMDYREKRITAYLNLLDKIVKANFEEIKDSVLEKGSKLEKYIEMLPDYSTLKKEFLKICEKSKYLTDVWKWVQNNLIIGSIDVNIMTKLDRVNYYMDNQLPVEYNDAHSALRGFAKSTLKSSVIFSAGINPNLYSYIENFDDFYPDSNGQIKKKITLKVSDYRSALIQGKFLAKKGLWVSEYRVESGLNCGGHAFASDGFLLGPILEEFKNSKESLVQELFKLFSRGLEMKNRVAPQSPPKLKITAQGGVGTAAEHEFLLEYYKLDSVGWGTPFLLVPEVVNVDENTLKLLCEADENDLYLSDISPLGIPFNSLKNNTKDIEKNKYIEEGNPGSVCPKRYLALNTEFTEKAICTASRQYQYLKILELDAKNETAEEYRRQYNKIIEKSCICTGLGTAALIRNRLDTTVEGTGVSVCPGPNMAFFSKSVSLKEMTDHIYGKINILNGKNRPNMFLKELEMYIDYLKIKIRDMQKPLSDKYITYIETYRKNIVKGINYYKDLYRNFGHKFDPAGNEGSTAIEVLDSILNSLHRTEFELQNSTP